MAHTAQRHARRWTCAALIASMALFPTVGWAQGEADAPVEDNNDVQRVEELSAKGTDAFRAGRYKEAIGAFEQAYAITPVANLLYNIALCYEKLNDLDNAHAYYKRFIVAPDANADVRSTALARMDEIDQLRRNKAVDPLQGGGPGGGGGEKKTPPKDNTWMNAGLITGGTGLALLGAGAVFGVLTISDTDDFDNSRDPVEKARAKDDATQKALVADVFYGLGAAALITGGIFIIMDLTQGQEEAPPEAGASVRPMIAPDGAGAMVEFSF